MERSFHMSSSPLKQPFQYKKIKLDNIYNNKKSRAENTAGTMKRIGSYLLKEKGKLFLVILMVIMSSGLGLLGPYLVGMAIDEFIVEKETEGVLLLLFCLLFIYFLLYFFIFFNNYLIY